MQSVPGLSPFYRTAGSESALRGGQHVQGSLYCSQQSLKTLWTHANPHLRSLSPCYWYRYMGIGIWTSCGLKKHIDASKAAGNDNKAAITHSESNIYFHRVKPSVEIITSMHVSTGQSIQAAWTLALARSIPTFQTTSVPNPNPRCTATVDTSRLCQRKISIAVHLMATKIH